MLQPLNCKPSNRKESKHWVIFEIKSSFDIDKKILSLEACKLIFWSMSLYKTLKDLKQKVQW